MDSKALLFRKIFNLVSRNYIPKVYFYKITDEAGFSNARSNRKILSKLIVVTSYLDSRTYEDLKKKAIKLGIGDEEIEQFITRYKGVERVDEKIRKGEKITRDDHLYFTYREAIDPKEYYTDERILAAQIVNQLNRCFETQCSVSVSSNTKSKRTSSSSPCCGRPQAPGADINQEFYRELLEEIDREEWLLSLYLETDKDEREVLEEIRKLRNEETTLDYYYELAHNSKFAFPKHGKLKALEREQHVANQLGDLAAIQQAEESLKKVKLQWAYVKLVRINDFRLLLTNYSHPERVKQNAEKMVRSF